MGCLFRRSFQEYKQSNYEFACIEWNFEGVYYQYSPDYDLKVSSSSSEKLYEKMQLEIANNLKLSKDLNREPLFPKIIKFKVNLNR